jgi:hypothetical protein
MLIVRWWATAMQVLMFLLEEKKNFVHCLLWVRDSNERFPISLARELAELDVSEEDDERDDQVFNQGAVSLDRDIMELLQRGETTGESLVLAAVGGSGGGGTGELTRLAAPGVATYEQGVRLLRWAMLNARAELRAVPPNKQRSQNMVCAFWACALWHALADGSCRWMHADPHYAAA